MVPIVYNKEGIEQIATLVDCIECLVEEERNGILELTLVYPNNIVAEQLIQENIIVADVNDTLINQQFRIYDVVKLMDNQLEVTARHISFDLAFDIIDSIDITNQSCEYTLNTIFRNSQFSTHYLGHSDIINAQDYSISKCSCQEAICGKKGSIIDTFGTGAEILRDNTDIYVYNNRGHDNDVTIEYAKNLTGFELEEDTSELITRIIPYAKFQDPDTREEREIWVTDGVDSPLIGQYAHPYIQYIDYSDKFEQDETPTINRLVEMARAEFEEHGKDRPKQNFKIEFIPLSKCVGYEGIEDKISLCDTVTIIDTRYNINTKAKVIKTVYNVLKDRYESMELGDARSTLNDILTGDGNKYVTKEELSETVNNAKPTFPNTLPEKPTLTCNVRGFASIELNWTYESQVFYEYELYASKIEDFTPTTFDLIHKGQSSSFLFQVEPDETWYFRVCAVNTHGRRTEFSNQATGTTQKIDDMENYFTSAAIGNALIGSLNADYMTAGIIQGHWIDARNLSVTDGNGKRTLDIDSFGNVSLDVSNLKISSKSLSETYATKGDLQEAAAINDNFISNGRFVGAVAEANAVHPWVLWGASRIYTTPYTEERRLQIQMLAENMRGGIYQELTGNSRPGKNTVVTLSAYVETQQNVLPVTVYFEYILAGTVVHEDGFLCTQGNNVITCTTYNGNYDTLRISFNTDGLMPGHDGSYVLFYINDVKLELGSVATGWAENTRYEDTRYTTKTEFNQTAEDFTFKIQQTGGYNLIKNSTADGGMNGWTGDTDNSTYFMTTLKESNPKIAPNGNVFGFRNPSTTTERCNYSPRFPLKPNTTYTLSAWVQTQQNVTSLDIFVLGSESIEGTNGDNVRFDSKHIYHLINGVDTGGAWRYVTQTFTTKDGIKSGFVRIDHNGLKISTNSYVYIYWGSLMLTEGSIALPWSPHPSEVYDGIVKIDKDGLTVTHSSHSDFKTVMSATGFECIHTNTKSTLFDSEGLHTKLLHNNGSYRFKHKSLITKGTILTQGLGYDETLSIILPWQYNDLDANNDVSLMLVCNNPIADGYNWYNISYWNMSSGVPVGSWYKNGSGYWQCDNLYAYCLISARDPKSDGTYHTEWARMYVNYIVFA